MSNNPVRIDVEATYGTWHGDLVAVDAEKVTIETPRFGRIEVVAHTVKAIRYAEKEG